MYYNNKNWCPLIYVSFDNKYLTHSLLSSLKLPHLVHHYILLWFCLFVCGLFFMNKQTDIIQWNNTLCPAHVLYYICNTRLSVSTTSFLQMNPIILWQAKNLFHSLWQTLYPKAHHRISTDYGTIKRLLELSRNQAMGKCTHLQCMCTCCNTPVAENGN